ncbi:MAG TPA: hypothetical protein DDW52_02065 [Planctomycetaceae bacterium]|nr:hypothetical protein [Planctomycetaceae bacterium]
MQAGEYPLTVALQKPRFRGESNLGHPSHTFDDVRKCAARLWQRSASEIAAQPADLEQTTLRLLLRHPPAELALGWGVIYKAVDYRISSIDERDTDRLVTLEPR